MDPASYFDSPELTGARNSSSEAIKNYSSAKAEGMTLPQRLTEALNKKFSTDNPMVQQREGQLTNYMNTTTQAPLDYTHTSAGGNSNVVYNPMEQANLINQRRTSALVPLTTTNYLLGLNQGGIGDVVDSVSNLWGADTQRMGGAAEAARLNYTDLLDMAKTKSALASNSLAAEEDKRRWEAEMALKGRSGSGGGGGLSNLESILQQYMDLQNGGGQEMDLSGLDAAIEDDGNSQSSQPQSNLNWQQRIAEMILPGTQYGQPIPDASSLKNSNYSIPTSRYGPPSPTTANRNNLKLTL